jgi:hypothetical protein
MFKKLKPELSDMELLERFNDICKQVNGRKTEVTMKQFTEGDDERGAKRSRTCSSEDESEGYYSSAEDSAEDDSLVEDSAEDDSLVEDSAGDDSSEGKSSRDEN